MTDSECPCYVGRYPCGCIYAVTCDDDPRHAKDTAKFVAEIIRRGDTVERMTVAEAKADPLFFPKACPHKPIKSQPELFEVR